MSRLCFSREEKTKKIPLIGSKFGFPHVDICSDAPKCKFF